MEVNTIKTAASVDVEGEGTRREGAGKGRREQKVREEGGRDGADDLWVQETSRTETVETRDVGTQWSEQGSETNERALISVRNDFFLSA